MPTMTLPDTFPAPTDVSDWRHCSCKCSVRKTGLCGADLTGRTPLGFRPPEEYCCPMCTAIYETTTNCPRCGRRWSNR